MVGSDFDWSATSLNNGGTRSFPALAGGALFANESYTANTKWTATSTATVGLARDRWMLYSKAGVAWAHDDFRLNVAGQGGFGGPGVPFAFSSTASDTVTGWTVGVGLKWAIWDNWFANVEYDYLDFGSKAQNLSGTFTAQPAAFVGASPGATFFSPTFNQNISELERRAQLQIPAGLPVLVSAATAATVLKAPASGAFFLISADRLTRPVQ